MNEWDFSLEHNAINTPKEKIDRKFYNLSQFYGMWILNYRNMTTNLMQAADGVDLRMITQGYVSSIRR